MGQLKLVAMSALLTLFVWMSADQLLTESAIVILAGEGREDRMLNGSYAQLADERESPTSPQADVTDFYLPEPDEHSEVDEDNPF